MKASDYQYDVGMHTLMFIAILISGICSDQSCIVSGTNRRRGAMHCLVLWDSMPAVLTLQLSIPFLRAQGAWVWGSGHLSISLILYSLQVKMERITCWDHGYWLPVLENNKYRAASICTLYIMQTNVAEYFMISSVSSPMPNVFRKPWCSLKIFHDDRLV